MVSDPRSWVQDLVPPPNSVSTLVVIAPQRRGAKRLMKSSSRDLTTSAVDVGSKATILSPRFVRRFVSPDLVRNVCLALMLDMDPVRVGMMVLAPVGWSGLSTLYWNRNRISRWQRYLLA